MGSDDVATADVGRAPGRVPGTRPSPVPYRVTAIASWGLLFVIWAQTRHLPYLHGLLFVLLGACALLLTTLAAIGWRVAALRTLPTWEAAARAAWTTGGLGTVVFFETVLFGPSEGLAATANALALSFVPALFGGILAAGLLALALRAAPGDGPSLPAERPGGSAWDLWLGRVLFVVLVAWPILRARLSVTGPHLTDSFGILHWPAVLVLLGTVAAMSVLGGAPLRDRAASAALAGAGTLTSLFGLVQALVGVANADVAAVSAGLNFLVTSCVTTLLALALVTYPRDDRRLSGANEPPLAARVAWVLFPLLAIGLMAVTFLMILTPMTRRP